MWMGGSSQFGMMRTDGKISATPVGKFQIEIFAGGQARCCGANDVSDQFRRKACLWDVQQVNVTEIRDLDPALAACPLGDEKRIQNRAKPGGDDEVGIGHQRPGHLWHGRHLAGRFHQLPYRSPARPGS